MVFLSSIFGKRNTIDNIRVQDLRSEQIKLATKEKALVGQITSHERQAAKNFQLGSSPGISTAQSRIYAREVSKFKARQRDKERQAMDISGKLMAIDRLVRMKERQRDLEEKGIWKTIGSMDLDKLGEILLEANIRDEQQRAMVSTINEVLGIDESGLASEEDPEISIILQHMDSARESGRVDEEFDVMTSDDSQTVFGR